MRFRTRNGPAPVFDILQAQPLSFADLRDHLANGKDKFKIRARVRVHPATNVPDLPVGSEKTLDLDMSFPAGMKHYALVPGGVLPPDFLLRGGTRVLLDRNVLSDLRAMPARDRGPAHPLRWLDSDGFHVNPILGAMEGTRRRPLTWREFRAELTQIQRHLRRRLRRANLVEFADSSMNAMYKQHRLFAPRLRQEQDFLLAISARLVDSVAKRDLLKAEQFVLDAAAGASLRPLTFVVLTALAKVYEGTEQRPAGKLLKLNELRASGKDWRRSAYNALADIRQMEMLSTAQEMPDYVAAMTGDVALAQVWCGLRPTGAKFDDGTIGFYFRLDPALFPRLDGTTDSLIERIKARGIVTAEAVTASLGRLERPDRSAPRP